jgi:hypothetical protein
MLTRSQFKVRFVSLIVSPFQFSSLVLLLVLFSSVQFSSVQFSSVQLLAPFDDNDSFLCLFSSLLSSYISVPLLGYVQSDDDPMKKFQEKERKKESQNSKLKTKKRCSKIQS